MTDNLVPNYLVTRRLFMSSPIEQIKERLDIVELIGSYVRLEKAGSNFKARCPFHGEKTPSFFVSPARQMWHCFGCSKGGDHFQFIQELEGVEFPEALKILAERTGVELLKEDPRIRSERVKLLTLLEEATRFFEANLFNRKDVGAYLKDRGLTGETAKRFRLGYAENKWDALLHYLRAKGYSEYEIEQAGLLVKKEGGGFYDRFRARIMFPFFDSQGRIVGFSGRIFASSPEASAKEEILSSSAKAGEGAAKYINTPQTVLYDKSKLLYGFHAAKNAIREKNEAILVEGQMDLIMSHQAGVENVVAVSGTALTSFHLNILRRLASSLLMAFDMDTAGLGATDRGIALALEAGFDVKIVNIAQGKDPADLIKISADAWKEAIKEPKHIITFLIDAASSKYEDKRFALKELRQKALPYIAKIPNDMERAHWVKEIAARFTIAEESIWAETKKFLGGNKNSILQNNKISQAAAVGSRKDVVEERFLGLLAWKGFAFFSDAGLGEEADFFSPARRSIFSLLCEERSIHESDHYIKKLALEAELAYAYIEDDALRQEVTTLRRELKREHARERLEALTSEIRLAERDGRKDNLVEKLEEFKKYSEELFRIDK